MDRRRWKVDHWFRNIVSLRMFRYRNLRIKNIDIRFNTRKKKKRKEKTSNPDIAFA